MAIRKVTSVEKERTALKMAVGISWFDKVDQYNLIEIKEIQEKINVLQSYFVFTDSVNKTAAIENVGKIIFLKKLAKQIGPAIGKYAQYNYGYDLKYAQNTDKSIDTLAKKKMDKFGITLKEVLQNV